MGSAALSAQAAAAEAAEDLDAAALLRTLVRRGEAPRAANQETRVVLAAIRTAKEPPADSTPSGTTQNRRPALTLIRGGKADPKCYCDDDDVWDGWAVCPAHPDGN